MKKLTMFKSKLFLLIICLCFLGAQTLAMGLLFNNPYVYADSASTSASIAPSNSDFNSSTSKTLQENPSGWTKISGSEENSDTKAGVITIDSNFESFLSDYGLESTDNPGKTGTDTDDQRVLMINAKNSPTKYGFTSENIALSPYSYYYVCVNMKTQHDAIGSIYLEGLNETNDSTNSFIAISQPSWKKYYFAIKTGHSDESITIQLWLGSNSTVSAGAVFFDNIIAEKISEKTYYDISTDADSISKKTLTIDKSGDTLDLNSELDNRDFSTSVNPFTAVNAATGSIVNVATNPAYDNQSYNNIGCFKMENSTKSFSSYKYSDISINRYGMYKLSFDAKIIGELDGAGNVSFTLKEQDIVKDNHLSTYTPKSVDFSSITTNSENIQKNNFNTYSFLIKGNGVCDTKFDLIISLGSNESTVKGILIIDDLSLEGLTHKQYSGTTSDSLNKSLELTIETTTPVIANGHFNKTESASAIGSAIDYFPIIPNTWEHSIQNGKTDADYAYGVINTEPALYVESLIGTLNPGNPNPLDTNSSNNILMFRNKNATYQSVTSSSFTLSATTTNEISFDVKTSLNQGHMYAYLVDIDNNENILACFENIDTNSAWTKCKLIITAGSTNLNVKLKLMSGKETDLSIGYVFIDNVRAKTITPTDEQIKTAYENQNSFNKVANMQDGLWNIKSSDKNTNGLYDTYAFNISATGSNYAGVINGKDNGFDITSKNESLYNQIIVINNDSVGTTTLTSKYSISFTTGVYYKISLNVMTRGFVAPSDTTDRTFGALIQLGDLEETFKNIVSDELKNYTFYVYASESATINLKLNLISDQTDVLGMAFFDNFKVEEITSVTFEENTSTLETNPKDNVLKIGELSTEKPEEETTSEDPSANRNNEIWLWLPTALLALVIIAALIALPLRKIKIKKVALKRMSSYNRVRTLDKDVAKREAETKINSQIADLQNEIKLCDEEKANLEKTYQNELNEYKQNPNGRLKGYSIEKKYKLYAAQRVKLEQKKQSLNDKIEGLKNPEYLIMEESKILLARQKHSKKVDVQAKKTHKQNVKAKAKTKKTTK